MEISISLKYFDRFALIEKPCTLIIKNNSRLNYDAPYSYDDHTRWLLTLRAVTKENMELIESLLEGGKFISHASISHLLLVGALWEEQVDNSTKLPTKGESVIATFDYVDEVMRCTNITLIPREVPKLYSYYKEVFNEIEELEKLING